MISTKELINQFDYPLKALGILDNTIESLKRKLASVLSLRLCNKDISYYSSTNLTCIILLYKVIKKHKGIKLLCVVKIGCNNELKTLSVISVNVICAY